MLDKAFVALMIPTHHASGVLLTFSAHPTQRNLAQPTHHLYCLHKRQPQAAKFREPGTKVETA